MRTTKQLFYSTLLVFISSFSFGQQWCWGRDGRVNEKSNDYCSPVATNRFGNIYITGQYSTVIIFGQDTLTDSGDNTFIVKYNSYGIVQWAVSPATSGDGTSSGISVVADAEDNAYVAGYSDNSNITFGSYVVGKGVFFVKYNSSGQVLWAKSHGGSSPSLAIDKKGNICLSTGDSLMKFNPNGNMFMKKLLHDQTNSIATDELVYIYSTGSSEITDTIFSSSNIPNIIKYDSNGNLLWEKRATIPTFSSGGYGNSVTTDNMGNAYITGYFWDTLCFGPDTLISAAPPDMYSNRPGYSLFLAKYSAQGNLLWVKQNKGKYSWRGTSLAKDENNFIYMGGSGIKDDMLSFGDTILTLPSSNNASFILKLDTAGNFITGSLLKNGTFDYNPENFNNEVAVDSSGTYAYLTGSFQNDTIVCANDTLFDGAAQACYVARWVEKDCTYSDAGINQISATAPSVSLFPNPSNGIFTIDMVETPCMASLQVYNMLGEKVYSQFSTLNSPLSINLSNQPNGVYLYRVISENGELLGEGKLIIAK